MRIMVEGHTGSGEERESRVEVVRHRGSFILNRVVSRGPFIFFGNVHWFEDVDGHLISVPMGGWVEIHGEDGSSMQGINKLALCKAAMVEFVNYNLDQLIVDDNEVQATDIIFQEEEFVIFLKSKDAQTKGKE